MASLAMPSMAVTSSLMCLMAEYWIVAFSLVMSECLTAAHCIIVYLMVGASLLMAQCLTVVCLNVACLMAVPLLDVSLNTVC